MNNFTTETYKMKRKIMTFSSKITDDTNKVQKKFIQDLMYGIVASKSVLLTDITDSLQENTKKINTVDRLSRNLEKTISPAVTNHYRKEVKKVLGKNPVILVDDSDVIKPHGKSFEALGTVRDGSSKNKNLEKGYTVTEVVGVSKTQRQPISLFSHIYSSEEKDHKSANTVTFTALDEVINLLDENEKGTFVFDRGYDMNALFKYMHKKEQHFIVRIKQNRKLFHKGKWFKSKTLRDARKGKIKTKVMFQNESKECYMSHLNVQITATKKRVNLILVYGLGDIPMMLITNKTIGKKSDVESILRDYMSRWRIEEYFRFKKQEYDFENYRVRSLKKMNNLNQILTYALGMLGIIAEKKKDNTLANMLIRNAKALRNNIQFYGYQISRGIYNTLKNAKIGIKQWQNIKTTDKYYQFELKLIC